MMIMRKDLLDKIVIEYRTNLVNNLYFILFEIWNLDQQLWLDKKMRILNIYDNRVRQKYTWTSNITRVRRILKDIE